MASPQQFQAGLPQGAGDRQIQAQAMPLSLTSVAQTDAYLYLLVFTNTTAGAITAQVQSRPIGASAVDLISSVSIPANSTQIYNFGPSGVWMTNGFSVLAGGAGLNYYAAWRQ